MIPDRVPRSFNGKRTVFLTNDFVENCIFTHKRMKLVFYFTLYTKINPKCIKEPNIRAKII